MHRRPHRHRRLLIKYYCECECLLQNCEPSIDMRLLHGLPILVPFFIIATHRGLVLDEPALVDSIGPLAIYFL